jgi:hypothetical protein
MCIAPSLSYAKYLESTPALLDVLMKRDVRELCCVSDPISVEFSFLFSLCARLIWCCLIYHNGAQILYHMSGQSTTVERTTNKLLEVMCYPHRFQQPPSAFVKLERLLPVTNHLSAAGMPACACFRVYGECLRAHLSGIFFDLSISISLSLSSTVSACFAAFRPLALAFRDAALLENAAKRTGAMRRFVYLATTSAPKLAEFERVFDR